MILQKEYQVKIPSIYTRRTCEYFPLPMNPFKTALEPSLATCVPSPSVAPDRKFATKRGGTSNDRADESTPCS